LFSEYWHLGHALSEAVEQSAASVQEFWALSGHLKSIEERQVPSYQRAAPGSEIARRASIPNIYSHAADLDGEAALFPAHKR
jgi:hypothetical protein